MTDSLSNIDFSTYYLGFPGDIQKSSRIRLFYKKDLNLSLLNLFEVNDHILGDSNYNESGFKEVFLRNPETGAFEVKCLGGEKFNSIIYYSDTLNTPVGFTIFSQNQEINIDENSRIRLIQIFTKFDEKISDLIYGFKESDGIFINTLSTLRDLSEDNTKPARKFLEDNTKPYNYSSVKDVVDYFSEENTKKGINYIRYSNSTRDFLEDPSYTIHTDCLTVINSLSPQHYCFSLLNGIEIDTYDTIYTKFFVSLYKNKLALFEFSEDKNSFGQFRVLSLTEKNRFGLPRVLVEKRSLPSYTENHEVISMSGDFIVFRNNLSNIWFIADISTEIPVVTELPPEYGILLDPWEEDLKVTYFSKNKVLNTIFDLFPKNSEPYRKLYSLPINESLISTIMFEKKIGEWFVFKTIGDTARTTLIYSSIYGSIYFDESEENFIIPITDRILLVQSPDEEFSETKFTFYFSRLGSPVYSDSYSKLSGFGPEVNNKISFNSSILDNHSKEDIITRKLLLDGLRRAPIHTYSFPKDRVFISSFRGLMFYIETDNSGVKKLFYL